ALLDAIHAYPIPEPSGAYDSLVEFDRRRVLKEQLLYSTIGTCLDTSLAVSALQGACARPEQTLAAPLPLPLSPKEMVRGKSEGAPWEPFAIDLERALFAGDPAAARAVLVPVLERVQEEPLL